MNAKKIMGAVLVALLAAALFVGAGAAATTDVNGKTVFIYQDLDQAKPASTTLANFAGTWTNGDMFVTIGADNVVVPSANFVPGNYKNGDDSIYVTTPAASFNAVGEVNTVPYIVNNGGNVYIEGTAPSFTATATTVAGIPVAKYQLTLPTGEIKTVDVSSITLAEATDKGTYKVQAVYAATYFKQGIDSSLLLDSTVFTFNVVGVGDATLVASVDSAYNGDYLTLTIEGTVGKEYNLILKGLTLNQNQFVGNGQIDATNAPKYEITMPNTGKVTLQVKVTATKDEAIATLDLDKDVEVKIKIAAPVITATAGSTTYFVGDIIKITGTTTADSAAAYNFTIEGTNFKQTKLLPYKTSSTDDNDLSGKNWKVAFDTAKVIEGNAQTGKKLDVGSYTIKVWNGKDVLATLVVSLKQPFISIVEAPEVVAQNSKAEFVINAEASAKGIKAYFFGTNFFSFADEVKQGEDIKTQYTAILEKATTDNMSTGQYFAVFQHPMYDGKFNINATADGAFYLNTEREATATDGQLLFKFNDRQTANAAQALCDALDTQNIDDMYVKYSFFIVGKDASYSISEIPSEVTKGTTITISGVDTANADKAVIVEMISTAFAAVPKEDVNAAAFVAVATTVAEDGTWEVTLDTSDLNVDEYAVTVKIAEELKKSVTVNVVEAKPDTPVTPEQPEEPEQPEQPEEPVAPATPGFGALAALAGLGAVAVLLLRRE